mgnify:CR=1 FL=1
MGKIPCTVIFRHASGFYNLKDLMQLNFKREVQKNGMSEGFGLRLINIKKA